MVKLLLLLAVLCALSVIGLWFGLGAHRGWSQTQIPEKKLDPVTEIEFTDYRTGFVPGIDFLVAGLIGSGVLFAIGLTISKIKPKTSTT